MANASFNLPIYFFAGKAFRENTTQMMKNFIPPFILKFYQGDTRGNLKFDIFSLRFSIFENSFYVDINLTLNVSLIHLLNFKKK